MVSKKKNIILKVTNKGIFYNISGLFVWNKTNFPSKKFFNFKERKTIYWEVKMLSFDKKYSELEVQIVDYNVINKEHLFAAQEPKLLLEKIKFNKLIWSYLEKDMNYYKRHAFKEIECFDMNKSSSINKSNDGDLELHSKKIFPIDLKYPIMKTTFKMGYVEFSKKIKGLEEPVTFALRNDHIIPEFDHVKPFFKKILGKRMIEVVGTIEKTVNGKISVNCHSSEISSIDDEMISSVRRLNLHKSIYNPKVIPIDKSLFTPEDFFEKTEELLGNAFKQSDKEIFNDIMDLEGIRNKRELIFLSGKLQSKKSRLRFTLSPKFGFLFHVKGEEMDHFIWELLDSNATYIWSIEERPLQLEMKYKLLQREINFIRDNGRRSFLDNSRDSEFIFSKVNHGASGIVDGFPKWRSFVTEKLV